VILLRSFYDELINLMI